jgi:hemerythrin
MTLHWTPALSIGVPEVDDQHRELFRRAERLIRAVRVGDRAEIGSLLEYLGEYVDQHFSAEEELMRRAGYPETGAHHAAHERFRAELAERSLRCEREGATAALALSLHNWLSDWLRSHVGGADLALGAFLRGRGGVARA